MVLGVIPAQARLWRFTLRSSGRWLCLLLCEGGEADVGLCCVAALECADTCASCIGMMAKHAALQVSSVLHLFGAEMFCSCLA